MDTNEDEENKATYNLTINYLEEERDCMSIELLSKKVVKEVASKLKLDVEHKKEYATIEIEAGDFYVFRLINIKNISSIDVDEDE